MFGISYWILPIFAGTVWLGTLAGMLGYWLAAGSPHYYFMGKNQQVAYISDIGATFLQPLFIAGSTTMVVVFDLTFIAERWLRHKNRLTPNYSRREAALSVCAILGAIAGAVGLILLTIYDIKNYDRMHDICIGVFIIGYIISAIFICAEYQRLGIHFREYRILRISFWIKLSFIIIEIGLAIGYGVTDRNKNYNISAILEWVVALVYIFYVWSFALDFLPATHTRRPDNRFPGHLRKREDPDPLSTQENGNMDGGPVYTSGGYYGNEQQMTEPGRHYQPSGVTRYS